MTIRLGLTALVLALAPQLGLAEGCPMKPQISASSCTAGEVWDPIQMTCVVQPSS